MRTSVVAVAATPFLIFAMSACSSSSSTGTTSEAPSVASSPPAAEGSAAAEVDAYCTKIAELTARAKALASNPDPAEAQALSQEATKLQEQAQSLAGAVAEDPSLAQKIATCSQEASSSLN